MATPRAELFQNSALSTNVTALRAPTVLKRIGKERGPSLNELVLCMGIGVDVLLDDVTLRIGDRSGCLAGWGLPTYGDMSGCLSGWYPTYGDRSGCLAGWCHHTYGNRSGDLAGWGHPMYWERKRCPLDDVVLSSGKEKDALLDEFVLCTGEARSRCFVGRSSQS